MPACCERRLIVTAMTADGSPFRHHAKAVRGTSDVLMPQGKAAAKVADILSGVPPGGGQCLIDTCSREEFAILDIAEASCLPKDITARLSKVVQG